MHSRFGRATLALATVFIAGCSFDLDLPTTPLQGTVTGIVDTQGHVPLAGNDVVLVSSSGAKTTAQTDSTGAFVFGEKSVGVYFIQVSLPGFATVVVPNVEVKNGTTTEVGTISPTWLQTTPSAGTMSGKVQVAGGGDATGAQVDFLLEGGAMPVKVASVAIGLSAEFTVTLSPGTYTLRASHPFYVTATRAGVTLLTAEVKDVMPLTMELEPATVTGNIQRELDKLPNTAAGKDALVFFDSGASAIADAQGNFSCGGLPAGHRTFTINLANHHDPIPSHSVDLMKAEMKAIGAFEMKLDRGVIAGEVVMADNTPVMNVDVTIDGVPYQAGVSPTVADPARGQFSFVDVPVGVYTLRATRPNYFGAVSGAITVVADHTVAGGSLLLTRIQGDFVIDDGDATNTPGYTNVTNVTLRVMNVTNTASYRAAENNPTLTGVTYTAFPPADGGFPLSSGEGTKTIYLQLKDGAGNEGPVLSANVLFDQTPPSMPSIVLSDGAAFTKVANPLPARVTALEGANQSGLAYVRLSAASTVDGAGNLQAANLGYVRDLSFTRPSSADGPQTVYAQFVDNAGNHSTVVSSSIVIDTLPPAGLVTVLQGPRATAAGFTDTPFATLSESATAEPNGGFVQVKLANAAVDVPAAVQRPILSMQPWELDPIGQGTKTVFYVLVDAAGNQAGMASATITYDSTPPSGTVALAGTTPTNVPGITLNFTQSDNFMLSSSQGLTLSEDPTFPPAGSTGPMMYPASNSTGFTLSAGDGPKRVFARFRDAAGNDAVASVAVTLDTTPPTGSISVVGALADGTPSSSITSSATVTVNVAHNGATSIRIGDEGLVSCVGGTYVPLTAASIPNVTLTSALNPKVVKACLKDDAGNTTLLTQVTIALDNTQPTGCALSLAGKRADLMGAPPAGKTALRDVTASLSGCVETPADMYLVAGTVTCTPAAALAWVPFNLMSTFTLPQGDGLQTVRGCVRDLARNTQSITLTTITLDSTPPDAVALTLDNGAPYVNQAQVTSRGGNIASAAGVATGAAVWGLSETNPPPLASLGAFSGAPQNFTFGGTGPRTLYAVFADDVGNLSPVLSAGINIDVTAPSTAGFTLQLVTPTNNGFSSTQSIVARPTGGANDATTVKLGEAAGMTCVAGDVSASLAQQIATSYVFVLSVGENQKQVCLQFFDAAGNGSTVLQASVTLDVTPPTAPQIVTIDQAVNIVDNGSFDVQIAADSTDTNFNGYQQLGGKVLAWSAVSASPVLHFAFRVINDGSEDGYRNQLRLRAVDKAGNASGEGSVAVTADSNAPDAITVDPDWIDNGSGHVTVYWQDPVNGRIAGHRVSYGSTPTSLTGTYAIEGNSPISAPAMPVFTLSGLTNGSPTFFQVAAVDAAGNVGPAAPGSPMLLQPNEVSPNRVTNLNIPSAVKLHRIANLGNVFYVGGTSVFCLSNPSPVFLQVIDGRELASQLQNGRITASPPGRPVVVPRPPAFTFNDAVICNGLPFPMDLIVDGSFLYMASGTFVRIFDLSVPTVPVLIDTLDFSAFNASWQATSIHLLGDRLVVQGRTNGGLATFVTVVSLAKLYDTNPATFPSVALDTLGTANNGITGSGGAALTRDRLVQMTSNSGGASHVVFNLADALDSDGLTTFNFLDRVGPATTIAAAPSRPPVSGSYMYLANPQDGLNAVDLTPAWSGGTLALPASNTSGWLGGGQLDVGASQGFMAAGSTQQIRAVDMSVLTAMQQSALYTVENTLPLHTLVYGNYLAVAGFTNVVFLETATPRALHLSSTTPNTGSKPTVMGGFLHTGGGTVYDMQLGADAALTSNGYPVQCTVGHSALFGETEVMAIGTGLRVHDFEADLDHNFFTNSTSGAADTYDITAGFTGSPRFTSLAAWGNYLVAVEVRAGGVFIETFNASKLRNRSGVQLTAADTRGSFLIPGTGPGTNSIVAELSITNGRAVVTIEPSGAGINNNVFVVDIRTLLDDDLATPSAAVQLQMVQASLFSGPAHQSAIENNTLYVAANNGLYVFDVTNAMDETPATIVTPPVVMTPYFFGAFDGVFVSGSMLLLSPNPNGGTAVYAFDVSTPLTPAPTGVAPLSPGQSACTPPLDVQSRVRHGGITAYGSKAYVTVAGSSYSLSVYDLE